MKNLKEVINEALMYEAVSSANIVKNISKKNYKSYFQINAVDEDDEFIDVVGYIRKSDLPESSSKTWIKELWNAAVAYIINMGITFNSKRDFISISAYDPREENWTKFLDIENGHMTSLGFMYDYIDKNVVWNL